MLKLDAHDRSLLWWEQTPLPDYNGAKLLTPLVLKHVDGGGMSCSICNWSDKCHGCLVQPVTNDAAELRNIFVGKGTFIACEWDINFFDASCDEQSVKL